MFNLQGSELIIILLLALVVLGPEKLPEAMRKAGSFYAELKKMSSGFQDEFRAAIQEPVKEMRETANVLRDSADFTKLQSGERAEKPRSAEMAAASDQTATPRADVPADDGTDGADDGSDTAPERPAQQWSFDTGGDDPAEAADRPDTGSEDAADGEGRTA